MSKMIDSIYNIRHLDELAAEKTIIHKMNPVVKLLVTIAYIIFVVSFGKYEITALIPYVFYPVIIFALSEIPFLKIINRVLIAMPFIIGIGIINPLFDNRGWISFASLVIKFSLTVTAGLLLIATTGIDKIAAALRKLFVPKIFVTQLLLTYRYISVLLEEAARIIKAYQLRAPLEKGVSLKASGSLLGQMLLRAFDRANRVYNAMVLRGFNGEYNFGVDNKLSTISILYLLLWASFFIAARLYNIPKLLERVIM